MLLQRISYSRILNFQHSVTVSAKGQLLYYAITSMLLLTAHILHDYERYYTILMIATTMKSKIACIKGNQHTLFLRVALTLL